MAAGLLLALLLAVAAHAPWCRGQLVPRYCHCLFQGNRHTADRQICYDGQDSDQLYSCRSELVPYIPDNYHFYEYEPQRLFNLYILHANVKVAREVCKQDGGRLATPENKHMFDFLTHMLQNRSQAYGIINYTDEQKEGVCTYEDGTPATSLPWEPNRPDNWEGDYPENCLEVSDEGLVNDINCNSVYTRGPFVCERLLLKKVPKGYMYYPLSKIFYKLYREEKPFYFAKKTCELDGGKLATPEDYQQVRSVIESMGEYTTAYVDFNDEAQEGNFVTSEGRSMHEMEFEEWRQGEPDNGAPYNTPENCVVFNSRGYYMDVPCQHTKPFVCQLIPY